MSLYNTYNAILSNPNRWKYYSRMNISSADCNVEHLFANEDNARHFIEKYFEAGNKLNVFDSSYGTLNNRWRHTLSVFFLGIALSDLLGINISEEDEEHQNKRHLYHWFLTCLYHDYGYTIEKNPRTYPPFELSIRKLFANRLNGTQYMRFKSGEGEFSNSIRWRYYDFCRNHLGFINHGIIGGLLLYNQLSEHLDNKIRDNGGRKDFTDSTGLHYSITHKKDFAICADAIIAHNIWFNVSPIEELRLSGTKHTYKRWLTALLVLCDTIEPLKAFPCRPPISVLEHIDVGIHDNSLHLAGTYPQCDYTSYINKCASLYDWTHVYYTNKTINSIILNDIRKLYQ